MAIRLTDCFSGGTLAATDGNITGRDSTDKDARDNDEHKRQPPQHGTHLGHRPPLEGHHATVHREGRQAAARFTADRAHAEARWRGAAVEIAAFGTLCRRAWRADRQPGGATGERRPAGL